MFNGELMNVLGQNVIFRFCPDTRSSLDLRSFGDQQNLSKVMQGYNKCKKVT